ncbi:methylated-DNA--[protein]-cysteine S-methyltransferase [Clostridium sp. 19966]|uniref:methylated-DNA--[protein]-cysteine S-methyltransferase n=1 Tax=Clostridium sp. 19966 TaxID=2768166 RepID=UPI0028DE00F6|nr:methylated-DNA--[protein]-cysteine S-methyltransferase [Clostridium sp. 19966]MDT8719320.1 methylated-DNA--[protein]-cysteine S-methyltransferase [Clostridium sp. 19966]
MENIYFYDTEIGRIAITDNGSEITNLYFIKETMPNGFEINETALIKEAHSQLEEYFSGKRKAFKLPLLPIGTDFQQSVWKALQDIPFGETRSYGEIAKAVGNPKASRAVGMANNRNPIPIFIPCHRVIGANGKLVGYGGGLDIKEHLLKLENSK